MSTYSEALSGPAKEIVLYFFVVLSPFALGLCRNPNVLAVASNPMKGIH